MKLFIDQCLSPVLADRINQGGVHEAAHPRDYGGLGEPDHVVLRRCLAEDRAIVTGNARDFRKLLGAVDIHPGLIVLPAVGRDRSWQLLCAALDAIAGRGEPRDVMVNRVVEIDGAGTIVFFDLPRP